MLTTRMAGTVLLAAGALLLGIAYAQAASIPESANNDFNKLVQAAGGSMSHTPGFPDVYKQMSANRRLLQNAYIGFSGLALLAAGSLGLVIPMFSVPRSEG